MFPNQSEKKRPKTNETALSNDFKYFVNDLVKYKQKSEIIK